MSALQLLNKCRDQEVRLWADGDRLRFKVASGALPADLREEITQYKPELLTLLRRTASTKTEAALVASPSSQTVFPLSPSQKRLWMFQQISPDSRAFHNGTIWHLSGKLNRELLEKSIGEIIGRQAILRTRIVVKNGEPWQQVDPIKPFVLPFTDLSDSLNRELELAKLVKGLKERPYDFSAEHSWRFHLVKMEQDDHRFVCARHHIASDGWSVGIFQRELSQVYEALLSDKIDLIERPTVQYADFALWQEKRLEQNRFDSQLSYWEKQLKEPPVLQLPTDFPRKADTSDGSARYFFELSKPLVDALNSHSQQHGMSLYMLMLAAYKVLLFRYTGQTDLIVGTPIAGRRRPEVEKLIGFFLNTLVMRSQLDPAESFESLLSKVRTIALNGFANQDIPIEKLIEELRPDRKQGGNPYFQTLFLVQNMPTRALELPGIVVERETQKIDSSPFDVAVTLREREGVIFGEIAYLTALFRPETIERMAEHYRNLLINILDDPTSPIGKIPMLTNEEKKQLITGWNRTDVEIPLERSVVDLLNDQVDKRRYETAFLTDSATLTYGLLDDHSTRLAHHLKSAGVRKGEVVGVCLPRSFDAIAALFAIFKIGAVYLPLDPTYPAERVRFMLEDSGAGFVITHQTVNIALSETVSNLIFLDDIDLRLEPTIPLNVQLKPEDDAYIVYTSGSTGRPKGALIPQKQILNRLHWMWDAYPFVPDEMSCQKTALSFVDSLWEMLGPLLQGSPTLIVEEEAVADPRLLIEALERHGVTRLWVVPTLLGMILDTVQGDNNRLSKLTFVVASGESLPTSLAKQFERQMPHSNLYNLYGTSEVWDGTWYAPSAEHGHLPTVPIGRPIDNVEAYILDDHLQLVPIGVTGELCIGGIGLANRYLNQADLTAEKFPQHPFKVGERLYRSGDLARYLPSGDIEFIGRKDFQVKIRGYRVELGEIEAMLAFCPDVAQSAVIIQERSQVNRLVAYAVLQPGSVSDDQSLREFLSDRLPNYMIPAVIVCLDEMPLTPSGKVDRTSLPDPVQDVSSLSDQLIEPTTQIEMQLLAYWRELLELDRISMHDNFFELGGHSLLAIRLFNWIENTFGKQLPVATLFQHSSINQLAELLDRSDETLASNSCLVPIQVDAKSINRPLFCVHGFGGGVVGYGEMARQLGVNQPVYGLQAIGHDGNDNPDESIGAMATRYIESIQQVQPHGPYRVGGYCYGGVVAYEMACQLKALGEEVDFVGIFEGYAPLRGANRRSVWRSRKSLMHWFRNLPYWLSDFLSLGRKQIRMRIRRQIRKRWRMVAKRFGQQVALNPDDVVDDTADLASYQLELMKVHLQAMRNYNPKPYSGEVTLFRVQSQSLSRTSDPEMGWGKLADSVQVAYVDGSHNNILELPHVRSLSAALRESLTTDKR